MSTLSSFDAVLMYICRKTPFLFTVADRPRFRFDCRCLTVDCFCLSWMYTIFSSSTKQCQAFGHGPRVLSISWEASEHVSEMFFLFSSFLFFHPSVITVPCSKSIQPGWNGMEWEGGVLCFVFLMSLCLCYICLFALYILLFNDVTPGSRIKGEGGWQSASI
jgi:hypothetical protein